MTTTLSTPGAATAAAPGPGARAKSPVALISQLATVVLFFVAWYVFSLTPMAERAMMPGPIATIARLFEMLGTAGFWLPLGQTMTSWAIALVLCLVIGVPFGLFFGRNTFAGDSTKILIDFFRTIPSLALLPLALLLLGATTWMVVMVAFLAGVWPLLIQAIYAGRQVDPTLQQVSRSFRLTPIERLRFVLVPDVVAFTWPGIRLSVTATLLVTVGAELIGGAPGIGSSIQAALTVNDQVTMFAWVVTAALYGLLINGLLNVVQRMLLWWHPSMRKDAR